MATVHAPAPQFIRPWLRWPLRLYKALLVFMLLALLGNIAVVPLAAGAGDWPAAALGQVATLLALARAYPLGTVLVALALVLFFGVSLVAEREARREQAGADEAHTVDVSERAAVTHLEKILPDVAQAIADQTVERMTRALDEALAERIKDQVATGVQAELRSWVDALSAKGTALPLLPATPVPRVPEAVPRLDVFVVRERELAELIAMVHARTASDAVAVVGLAGVGKTALVAEAVTELSRDAAEFPGGVAWVWCGAIPGVAGLSRTWTEIARALRLEQPGPQWGDPEAARAAVLAALRDPARPRSLLVLDELAPGLVTDAVLDALIGGRAALVLTSRQEIIHPHVAVMRLEPLDVAAGTELFVRSLRQVDRHRPTSDDMAAIGALVGLLGGLPVAVSLAAQFAGREHQAVPELLGSLREAISPHAVLDRAWQSLTRRQQLLLAGLSLPERPDIPWATALAIGHAARAAEGEGDGTIGPAEEDVNALTRTALIDAQPGAWLRLHPLGREYASARLAELPENVRALLRQAAAD